MENSLIKKALSVVVLLAILIILLIMGRGNEDSWICVAGKWAKHGNPNSPMPEASQCQ